MAAAGKTRSGSELRAVVNKTKQPSNVRCGCVLKDARASSATGLT